MFMVCPEVVDVHGVLLLQYLQINTKRLTVHLEERLLWKLLQFAGFKKDGSGLQHTEDAYDTHRYPLLLLSL